MTVMLSYPRPDFIYVIRGVCEKDLRFTDFAQLGSQAASCRGAGARWSTTTRPTQTRMQALVLRKAH